MTIKSIFALDKPEKRSPTKRKNTARTPATISDWRLEAEFNKPYTAWKSAPSPRTTGDMLRAVDPIINKGLSSYAGAGRTSPVLRSHAKQIAISALESYDPKRAKLQTHLLTHLQGLQRVASQQRRVLSIPERVLLDRYHLSEDTANLQDMLGRDPSDKELADRSGLSLKRIEYIRRLNTPLSEGSFSANAEGLSLPAPAVQQQETDTWVEFVYGDLNDIDKKILEHTLGLHGSRQLSSQQIAQKLRISAGAVSQRAERIQKKLNQRDELGIGF